MGRKKQLQQKSSTGQTMPGPQYSRDEMLEVMRGKKIEPPSVFIEFAGCQGHTGRFSADKWVEHKWSQCAAEKSRKFSVSTSEARQKRELCGGGNNEVADVRDAVRDRMRALLSRPTARQQDPGKMVAAAALKPSPNLPASVTTTVPSAFGYTQQMSRAQQISSSNPAGGGVTMQPNAVPGYFNFQLAPTSPCMQAPNPYYYHHGGYYLHQGYNPQVTGAPTPSYLTSSLPSAYYPQQQQQASAFPFPAGVPQMSWGGLQQGQLVPQMPVVQTTKRIKPTADEYQRRGNLRVSTSDSGYDHLPEWVEGGPKNVDETVELKGFEESDKGSVSAASHESGGGRKRAVEDDDSDVMEFATKILNVALDPQDTSREKPAAQKPVKFSRMSRFFTSYRTPERNGPSGNVQETGGVSKSVVRRLAQSGEEEELTKVDRPTATPPVLRQLFASAKEDTSSTTAMPSLGEGVKVDELERKLIAQSSSSRQSSQPQSMESTPSKLLPPPLQVPNLSPEDVRSARAQLQYGWSPKKRVTTSNANSSIPTYAQPPSSYQHQYYGGPTPRYLSGSLPSGGLFMQQGAPNVQPLASSFQPYSPSPYSMRVPIFSPSVPGQYVMPRMQQQQPQEPDYSQQPSVVPQPTSQQVTQMLSANPSLRAEFVDFITRKIQAYQSGSIQEPHLGKQAILSQMVDVSSRDCNAGSAGQVPSTILTDVQAGVSSTSNSGVANADAQKIVDHMINMKL